MKRTVVEDPVLDRAGERVGHGAFRDREPTRDRVQASTWITRIVVHLRQGDPCVKFLRNRSHPLLEHLHRGVRTRLHEVVGVHQRIARRPGAIWKREDAAAALACCAYRHDLGIGESPLVDVDGLTPLAERARRDVAVLGVVEVELEPARNRLRKSLVRPPRLANHRGRSVARSPLARTTRPGNPRRARRRDSLRSGDPAPWGSWKGNSGTCSTSKS